MAVTGDGEVKPETGAGDYRYTVYGTRCLLIKLYSLYIYRYHCTSGQPKFAPSAVTGGLVGPEVGAPVVGRVSVEAMLGMLW